MALFLLIALVGLCVAIIALGMTAMESTSGDADSAIGGVMILSLLAAFILGYTALVPLLK